MHAHTHANSSNQHTQTAPRHLTLLNVHTNRRAAATRAHAPHAARRAPRRAHQVSQIPPSHDFAHANSLHPCGSPIESRARWLRRWRTESAPTRRGAFSFASEAVSSSGTDGARPGTAGSGLRAGCGCRGWLGWCSPRQEQNTQRRRRDTARLPRQRAQSKPTAQHANTTIRGRTIAIIASTTIGNTTTLGRGGRRRTMGSQRRSPSDRGGAGGYNRSDQPD